MKKYEYKFVSENGYELKRKLYDYILGLLHKYEIPEDVALSYVTGITNVILNEISVVAPDKYDRYFLNDWREDIYCILNELWRVRDPRAVFVVQSQEDWERLSQIPQNGNIYIPNFIADEIVPIENNTNIFIYTEDIPAFSNEIIDLRPRIYATIVQCLSRAGMDVNQANEFVAETHGLYVAMKKKLFNGQLLKQPKWLSELDNKIRKTCLLLGQWTECEGDTVVVENLSGMTYKIHRGLYKGTAKC